MISVEDIYKIGEWKNLKNDFREIFHIEFAEFYDGFLTVLFRKVCIDFFKFDDWLHAKYGIYEDDGKSMQDVIIEHYGIEGDKLIDKLI